MSTREEELPEAWEIKKLENAKGFLGEVANIKQLFIEFQHYLYNQKIA